MSGPSHEPGDLIAKVASLRRVFESLDVSVNQDEWAYSALRLGTALAEVADSNAALQEPIALLRRAQRVLTADRAPVEHGRIATVLGTCFRRIGETSAALSHMDTAARLLRGRVSLAEHAATESNLATVLMEGGKLTEALPHADLAVKALAEIEAPDETERRALIAAYLNRGIIRQAMGGSYNDSRGDFVAVLDLSAGADTVLQRGMAHHALGVLNKEHGKFADALSEFGNALLLLTSSTFPMQHAICRFNSAVTNEALGGTSDLRRALRDVTVALTIFDQRLHIAQRSAALEVRSRVITALAVACPDMTMSDHQIQSLLEMQGDARLTLMREIFSGVKSLPSDVRSQVLLDLCDSLVKVPDSEQLMLSLVTVIMEFPDGVLVDTLSALVASIHDHSRRNDLSREVDNVIHAVLHGPQRVRVRDVLEYFGWERP